MVDYCDQARFCYESGDYKQSVKLLKIAVDKGNADAMFLLGVMYLLGQGVDKDIKFAKSYIKKAKWYNHPVAMFYLDIIKDLTQKDLDDESIIESAI